MSEWTSAPLEDLATITSGGTPSRVAEEFWNGDIPWVTPSDITSCRTKFLHYTKEKITAKGLASSSATLLPRGSLLFTSRATIGEIKIAVDPVATNQGFKSLSPKPDVDGLYLFFQVERLKNEFVRFGAGSTFLEINRKDTGRVEIPYPVDRSVQTKIANILQTIDQAIEKTEALIKKYGLIKAGMMHDLFTRGLTPDGKQRPPRHQAPELYKKTPIGWIPKEWECEAIETVKNSLVDGPFGSNLKTKHYVVDPGVRVVRLQNIETGRYNDLDRAFVSDRHALLLHRNRVDGGDILIAGLGEERHPVARACLYPRSLPAAINKADCFRLRCDESKMINAFVVHFLNTAAARKQVRRYEQGVTRPRINLGNMNRLLIPKPTLDEQNRIVEKMASLVRTMELESAKCEKLYHQKSGLMQDLLTGKVPVKVDEPEAAHV
tara:strand:+ start:7111 stop:8418 length:1308 start_codon:yes stop_codon:yes gene_type:complete